MKNLITVFISLLSLIIPYRLTAESSVYVTEDRQNRIWFGSDKGLYYHQKIKRTRKTDPLSKNKIKGLSAFLLATQPLAMEFHNGFYTFAEDVKRHIFIG